MSDGESYNGEDNGGADAYIPMEMDLTQALRQRRASDEDTDSVELTDNMLDAWFPKVAKYARRVLPHVGLVILLAVYTLAGAVVFHILELPEEEKNRATHVNNVIYIRDQMKYNLWRLANETAISSEHFAIETDFFINELINASFAAFQSDYIRAPDLVLGAVTSSQHHWDFPNSIFFAITVITTIGYGHLAPRTEWGRIFCIGFGLMGIPLLLVTIADIGKFLSDFLNFMYRTYRNVLFRIRSTTKTVTTRLRRSISSSSVAAAELDELAEAVCEEDEHLRIPMAMVLLVLLSYTAAGGLLFQYLEGWKYFDAFYFCFITMSTVGFGDLVPSEQAFMMITMGYIMMGLALTTMCIDLAGTEYIRKIHYLGQKMETAKSAVVSGLHAGETMIRTTGYGFIRTTSGKLVAIKTAGEYSEDYWEDDEIQRNILYEPLSPAVLKAVEKAKIEVMPDHITPDDVGYTIQNKVFERRRPQRRYLHPNQIHTTRIYKRRAFGGTGRTHHHHHSTRVILVAPFLWKESHV